MKQNKTTNVTNMIVYLGGSSFLKGNSLTTSSSSVSSSDDHSFFTDVSTTPF